jgi:hypothetical protein
VARNRAGTQRPVPKADHASATETPVLASPSGHPKALTRASRAELDRRLELQREIGALSPRVHNLTISPAARFVWFRNAKVGTRTIQAFLDQHFPEGLMVLSEVPYPTAEYADYFKFGFVRHPLDRFISSWQNKVCDTNHFRFNPEKRAKMQSIERFAAWVAKQDIDDLATTDRHIVRQARLVDLTQVDFVGRMESFTRDFGAVCERLGLQWSEPERRNRSEPSGITRENASEELRAIVEEVYRLDYQVFGY